MYKPLDMNQMRAALPAGGNEGISMEEQRMLDNMMQDYYKDKKYNSAI